MENTAIIVEEHKIDTNVTMKMSLGVIKSNLSMIEKSVDKVVSDLKNTTYAGTREDRIKMMKKDRADCNKAIAALETERKKQKKIFSKPWDDFEIEVKSLVAKIESAATAIDNQVKTLEEERRSEVRKNIRKYYDTISEPVGEFREELYQKVYDASWENVSSSMKAYKDGLKKAVDDYVQGINTISSIDAPDDIKSEALMRYKNSLDAMASVNYIIAEKQKQEELRKRIEEETRRKLEAQKQREIEEAKRKAAAEERARLEAERRAEEERARQEEARQRELELKRMEDEKKQQAKNKPADTLHSLHSDLPNGFTPAPSAFDFGLLGGNSAFDDGVPADADKPTQTKDKTKVTITFDADEWSIVKEYCEEMQIFFFVNK